ncbi:hypothetical protein DFH07DRAFT_765726 [Mycena maculata]|uniref:Uncharacterized protein n=1 Tax=Mycena maculata TaxID=230809 RepID=A0AAD7NX52_9AGAR|nr:hypothetical protein DFH07DRAFT_765726 [Mycena maculata]
MGLSLAHPNVLHEIGGVFIGTHKAPPNLSRTDFEDKLGHAIAALAGCSGESPQIGHSAAVRSASFRTDIAKHSLGPPGELRWPPGAGAHYADFDRLWKDPALQNLLTAADDGFGLRDGATAFAADIITEIDASGATAGRHPSYMRIQSPASPVLRTICAQDGRADG